MSSPMQARFLAGSRALGAGIVALGAAVLAGWALDLPLPQSLQHSLIAVKANTAVCLLLAGALLALRPRLGLGPRSAIGLAVALVGALTAVEWLGEVDLGIDQLLFAEPPGAVAAPFPGRMSVQAALGFLALGLALAALDRGPRLARLAQGLALAAGGVGLLALVGYLYGASELYRTPISTPITPHAAAGIFAAALAVLLARTDVGLGALLASEGPGGLVARRLLPVSLVVPLALALLAALGARAGLYDEGSADGLRAVVLIALLSWLTVTLSLSLDRVDAGRVEAAAQLAASERRYRALFEHLSSGFALCRLVVEDGRPVDFVYVEANAAFERQTGWTRDQVIGKPITALIADYRAGNARWFEAFASVVLTGEPTRVEDWVAGLDRWYECTVYRPLPGHFACVFEDVSERKLREREVQELNQDLARRTRELTAANAELEAFAYSVSHDLRAPLRSIAGFSQAALEDFGERLGDRGRQYLTLAVEGSRDLGRLIDDLLSLSRVTRVEMTPVRVDLAAAARELVAGLAALEPEREVSLVAPPRLDAWGDPALLRLVLQNLLGNAWKFTSRHPTARIELGLGEREGRPAYFVADDGAGFDPRYAQKLMKPFQRLHSIEEFAGSGVGLATVNRIVRRHGGEVWVEGAVERGATVWFSLPAERRSDDEGDPAGRGQPEGRAAHRARVRAEPDLE